MKELVFVLMFSFFLCSCTDQREKIGEDIYKKIIKYQKINGRIPNELKDIGLEDEIEGPIYYHKQTDSTFIIYYGGGLGESVVYNPKTKKWNSDRQ